MPANEETIKVIQRSKPGFKKLLALMTNAVNETNLKSACKSLDWLERAAIARNMNTPIDILELLVDDPDSVVRTLAQKNLNSKP